MPYSPEAAVEAAKRASARAAAIMHQDMKRGAGSLASIVSTAPLIGLFGSCIGVFDAFRGGSTERTTLLAIITQRLSESLVPAAMGLLVAISASWFYKFLCGEMEAFDFEMKNASSELVSHLMIYLKRTPPQP